MDNEIIALRTAKLMDAEAIARHNQAMAMETENKELAWETVFSGVKEAILDPAKGFYLLAEADGKIIGNLMITFEWSDWRNCNLWWFQSVFLQKEFRGKGIFAKMYAHIFDLAKTEGVKELRLYVEQDNENAQKVYRNLGMNLSHYQMWDVAIN